MKRKEQSNDNIKYISDALNDDEVEILQLRFRYGAWKARNVSLRRVIGFSQRISPFANMVQAAKNRFAYKGGQIHHLRPAKCGSAVPPEAAHW